MSEDKMLGDFERWAQSPNGSYLDAESAWKACAAIKDAEIANLVNAEAEAMALVLSHEGHIEKLNAEIAELKDQLDGRHMIGVEQGRHEYRDMLIAAEVRDLREKLETQRKIATEQIDYAISLQRAIEAHCRDDVAETTECPHHAEKLNCCLVRHNDVIQGLERSDSPAGMEG